MENKRLRDIIKSLNEFFGNAIFVVGLVRTILLTMNFIQMGTQVVSIIRRLESGIYDLSSAFLWLGLAEILIGGLSLMMFFLNFGYKPVISWGYFMMIAALLMEVTLPNIFFCYIECGMCMKAGRLILKKNQEKEKYYI